MYVSFRGYFKPLGFLFLSPMIGSLDKLTDFSSNMMKRYADGKTKFVYKASWT